MTAPSRRSAENQKLKTTGNDAAEKLNEHCEKGQVRGYRAHLDIRSRHQLRVRRVVALFAAVSKGDARPVVDGLAACFEHFFLGDHALGGSRFHAGENEAVVRAALSAAAGHQFRSARHPDFRAALEHSSRGGLAGKQFGDRRNPHLYARGPRCPVGVGRMTYIGIYPDTVGLVATLQRLSRAGIAEATAEKIEG